MAGHFDRVHVVSIRFYLLSCQPRFSCSYGVGRERRGMMRSTQPYRQSPDTVAYALFHSKP